MSTGSALQFRINGLTDLENISLAMVREYFSNNSTFVVAKLSAPIEYQLTPQEIRTLFGANNVWADTGDIAECEYPADTKLYIDGKIAEAIAALQS